MDLNGFLSRDIAEVPVTPASTLYSGTITVDEVAAGEPVEIEIAGEKQFETEVPGGKKWDII